MPRFCKRCARMSQRMFRRSAWGAAEWTALLLTLLAIPWLGWHLGHLPLWEDEAHTALFARNIVRTALPLMWDGVNLISGANGDDIGPHRLLTWDGPLQFYATALFFRMFGESEWSARLPFVLVALALLPLVFFFTRRLTQNAWAGAGSIALLLTSAPFLTHVRQCRYYSFSMFFCLLLLYGYYWLAQRRRDFIYFVIGGVGLFYSNPFSFIVIWPCLVMHCFVTHRRRHWPAFVRGSACIAIVTLPWFIFAELYAKQGTTLKPGIMYYVYRLIELTYKFNRVLFPIALWGLLFLWWRRARQFRSFIALTLLLSTVTMLGIAKMLPPACRYAIWFIPIAAILQMLIVQIGWQRSRWIGGTLLLLMLATNGFLKLPVLAIRAPLYFSGVDFTTHRREKLSGDVFQALRKTYGRFQYNNAWYFGTDWWWKSLFKMDLAAYWHEITHPYRDPIASLVTFFQTHAAPGDQALVAVDDFAMMYYLPWLRQAWMIVPTAANRAKIQDLPHHVVSYERMRWYVPRDIQRIKGPALSETGFIRWAYGTHRTFRRHRLDTLAYYWDGSRPETLERYTRQHSDRPLPTAPRPVVVYEILNR